MDNGQLDNELNALSSTYSLLTADRILDRFSIHLPHDALTAAMKNSGSVYFQILLVPFKNIINGIIFQQAYDYQVYEQKLFVDYFVSGSGNESAEGSGGSLREDMEVNRLKLVEMNKRFELDTLAHKTLIHESQGHLIDLIKSLKPLEDTPQHVTRVTESMQPFRERAADLSLILKNDRADFKALILDTLRLIELLPDYHADETQSLMNRSSIQFDDHLG